MNNTETSRYSIGADIGGSHISSAVVDLTTGQICTEPVTTPVDSCSAAEAIINAWSRNLTETLSSSTREIEGIGIAIPGPFDYSRGISLIKGVCKFETLFGLDVKQSLLGRLNSSGVKEIRFINDASAFALGEVLGGSARDCVAVMALTLGTGVGSGFVRDNELIESGQDIPANGWVYCLPFEGSTADDAFSTRWFIKRYQELTGKEVSGAHEIAIRCDSDPAARKLFDEFGSRLAQFTMPLLERFGCETLVLGGNIARSYDLFSPVMKSTFAQSGKIIDIKVSSLMDKAALVGAASLFKNISLNKKFALAMSKLRNTTQYVLPITKKPQPGNYDPYPVHDLGADKIHCGFDTLAASIKDCRQVVIDGYGGVRFDDFASELGKALDAIGIKALWWNTSAAMKPEEDIDRIIEPYLGGNDPLFGFRAPLRLEDFFDTTRLASIMPDKEARMNILIGPGAALAGWDATVIYIDIPKNEIQFRARSGNVTNLGALAPAPPKKMYKRFYFIDWIVMNRHKKELLPDIDIIVDGQREDNITWAIGDDLRDGLDRLSHNGFRVRPWFEPGAWGGQWIREHIPALPYDVPNYAWSFELIVPENGIIFGSDDKMLEVSFDTLMYRNGTDVVGKECYEEYGDEFPIRMDYLDNFDGNNLSIQCHPQRSYIRKNFGEVLTQEETYYILDTRPDAVVYIGFQPDIEPEKFRKALTESFEHGTPLDVPKYINAEPSVKHGLYLIPPGTLHSSGRNNLVLEISTTPYIFTFKMYDWLSLDLDGRPRPLNIKRAMDNLCFDRKGDKVKTELISHPVLIEKGKDWELWHLPTHVNHSYDVHRYKIGSEVDVHTEGKCHVLNLVEGDTAEIITEGGEKFHLSYAETLVISAAAGSYRIVNTSGREIMMVKAFMK